MKGQFHEKLTRFERSNPLFRVILLLGALSSALAAIVALIAFVTNAVSSKQANADYRSEYEVLNELELGVQIAFIMERLGAPAVSKDVSTEAHGGALPTSQQLTFHSFRRPSYVLTTLSNSAGSVQGLAVATCNSDFNPNISTPIGDVVLNRTSMATLGNADTVEYVTGGSGGFGYYVLDWFRGESRARELTTVATGQFYSCLSPSSTHDIIVRRLDGGYAGEFTANLNEHRREWQINAVLLFYHTLGGTEVSEGFVNLTEIELRKVSE